MGYRAVTSFNPPAAGQSKKFYSPDLFDADTGAYPKANLPTVCSYPADANGRIPFFEGIEYNRAWPTSDSGGGGAAYSAADQALSDLSQATESVNLANGGNQNETFLTWSWAGHSGTQSVKLSIVLSASYEVSNVNIDSMGESGGATAQSTAEVLVSKDSGATWTAIDIPTVDVASGDPPSGSGGDSYWGTTYTASKALLHTDLGTVDISAIRVKAHTKGGYGAFTTHTVTAYAELAIFALCLEGN